MINSFQLVCKRKVLLWFLLSLVFSYGDLVYAERGEIPLSYKIEDVPFYPQLDYYCGPASLASIINYWGGNVTQEEIGKRIYRSDLKGSLSIDLILYARERGYEVEVIKGDIERLKEEIRDNRPVLAFLNVGLRWLPIWHYLVVIGYDDVRGELITNSGRKQFKRYRYKDFLRKWEATDYWGLVIRLPEEQTRKVSPSIGESRE